MKKLLVLLMTGIYLLLPFLEYYADENLHIWALDVGQGDATLIRTPDRKLILVDTSGSDKIFTELSEVLPFWVRKIDLLVITHPHQDHIGMLKEVLERYEVETVAWFKTDHPNSIYYWSKDYSSENSGLFIEYFEDQKLSFDDVSIEFVEPELETQREIENVNNGSVVFILEYGNFVGIFPGDAEQEQEADMLEELAETGAFAETKNTYLKAGHHCSDTSSTEEFLDLIYPDIATCSVGSGNSYGHPSPETLIMFKERSIEYFRTDLDGTIEISTNGTTYEVKSER